MSGEGLIGREQELSYLEGLWKQKGLVTCCIWGRKRVGKTSLLKEFGKGKRTLFLRGSKAPITRICPHCHWTCRIS